VILLIGDGMGLGQVAAGRIHARGPSGRLNLERLPVLGLVTTHPAGALVAKSDSAATALATGRKTRNGRIGTDPDARPLPTITETLAAAGWATGFVTTTRITDATPASFLAHTERRDQQSEIAAQIAAAKADLLIGGGRRFFVPKSAQGSARKDERNLLDEMRSRGVAVVEEPAALAGASALPLAAIFQVEPQAIPRREPPIGALAAKAIELLSASGRPFFALIEDEEIDSRSHGNDLAGLSAALERFDEAVRVAVEFAAKDGSTLVLVTGDHSTGAPAIDAGSTSARLRVVWEGDGHTGEPVPIYAYGPPAAARRFTGVLDNTDIPRRIAEILGVAFPPSAEEP
jgi:alkaline phosphatase